MPELPVYQPMLATRWPQPFSDPEWAFEVKWDGVRAVTTWDGDALVVRSRTGRLITQTYPELAGLTGVRPCILDGEIVAFDEGGKPSFGHLQQRMNVRVAPESAVETPITYMVFDLLSLEGPLIDEPWTTRRDRLQAIDLPAPYLTAEPIIGNGEALWEGIVEQQLEGMVGKRRNSLYLPGTRSAAWRKVARVDQVRAVVGGYVPGDRGRASTFGSLLLGLVSGAGLHYIGSVGTGFTGATLSAIRSALDEMRTDSSPFEPGSDIDPSAMFVEPTLVALVEFKEWTRAGKLRAPSFKGFTDDDPTGVTWAVEGPQGR